ncbi:unnamed protein product [Linum trigynum]|uniref:Uncharacterized protein n=1 Tax=Linum trigynum TaxID=586398 RepID=A0AAV2GDV9_9ROSI
MVLFDFKFDKHFVASSDRNTLQVYELTNPNVNPSSSLRKNHWKEVATITARDDYNEDEGDDDGASTEEESFSGLMFFDGHGKIEGQEALTKLAQHLTRLQLRVIPQGLCFQDVTGLGEHKDFGFHYLRLNDLFNWPYHGIKMASIAMWRRLVLEYTVPKGGKRPMVVGGVSKERYEELHKKMIETKDEELGKLREKMEEQDWEMERLKKERGKHETELRELKKQTGKEMRQLREEMEERDLEIEKLKEESEKHEQELRDLEKKNNKELRKLSKKKDGELETLKREKDEEVEDKIDELEMLRKEKDERLKKLRDEVKNLKRAKKEDGAASGVDEKGKMMVDSDEWHKLKNNEAEMREEVANKDEALRRIMNEKKDAAAEFQKLRIEKEEMMKANAAETEKLRNQLSQLPRELEQRRRKQSWIQTAATKLVSLTKRNDQLITSARRSVPPDTWSLSLELTSGTGSGMFQYQSRRKSSWPFSLAFGISLVDEDPKEWLHPPKIRVYVSEGSFDKDNWWFTRTTHPDGGLTMMAYYDGDFLSSIFPGNKYPIRLPYAWDDNTFWADTACTLAMVGGEYKLAFMYRE